MPATIESLKIHHVGIAGGDATIIEVNYHPEPMQVEQPTTEEQSTQGMPILLENEQQKMLSVHENQGGIEEESIGEIQSTKDEQHDLTPQKQKPQQVTVLIDAGGEDVSSGPLLLASYIATQFPDKTTFDYIIASHYHADHIAGFQRCGIDFRQVVDIGGYSIGNDFFEPVNPLGNLSTDSGTLREYEFHVHSKIWNSKGAKRRLEIPFVKKSHFSPDGKTLQNGAGPLIIELVPNSDEVTLTCYCAGGVLADGTNALREDAEFWALQSQRKHPDMPKNVMDKMNSAKTRGDTVGLLSEITDSRLRATLEEKVEEELAKVNPNDLSLAFLLEWKPKDFRYWTAGDLSGDLSRTRYANIEEPLVGYLQREKLLHLPITVMKATHHGSNHNNYPASVRRKASYTTRATNEDDDDSEKSALPPGSNIKMEAQSGKKVSGENYDSGEFETIRKKGLLAELQPDTIIIPCNQMKGVPGGEFVERLQAYCTERLDQPTPLAIFVNQCKYPAGTYDDKQKASLPQFRTFQEKLSAATNLTRKDETANEVHNNDPLAVVVHVPPVPKDTATHFSRSTHSIIIKEWGTLNLRACTHTGDTGRILNKLNYDDWPLVESNMTPLCETILKHNEQRGVDDIAMTFPSLVDSTSRQLRFDNKEDIERTITNLFYKVYPELHLKILRLKIKERLGVLCTWLNMDGPEPDTQKIELRKAIKLWEDSRTKADRAERTKQLRKLACVEAFDHPRVDATAFAADLREVLDEKNRSSKPSHGTHTRRKMMPADVFSPNSGMASPNDRTTVASVIDATPHIDGGKNIHNQALLVLEDLNTRPGVTDNVPNQSTMPGKHKLKINYNFKPQKKRK
ncbi:MAG TPA: hypothetical protein VHG35_14755 [Gemmatimonadales bacterium]|nr:hypothetical protein [Gemmatimonadales bacterium]